MVGSSIKAPTTPKSFPAGDTSLRRRRRGGRGGPTTLESEVPLVRANHSVKHKTLSMDQIGSRFSKTDRQMARECRPTCKSIDLRPRDGLFRPEEAPSALQKLSHQRIQVSIACERIDGFAIQSGLKRIEELVRD